MNKLLFFTSATRFYHNYVTPYVFLAANHNPNCAFEFIVDDVEKFKLLHCSSIDWLVDNLKVVVNFRSADELNVKPKLQNSIRFIMNPITPSEYVYIGDVDIMILEDVIARHKPVFDLGLPYSNIVRTNTKRLTGLHLCKSSKHYPLCFIDDLVDKHINDEELLYSIVERKGLLQFQELIDSVGVGRPAHGIHMSLNRLPFSYSKERSGWGLSYKWLQKFNILINKSGFIEFYNTLYEGSQQVLLNLVYLSNAAVTVGKEDFGKLPKIRN